MSTSEAVMQASVFLSTIARNTAKGVMDVSVFFSQHCFKLIKMCDASVGLLFTALSRVVRRERREKERIVGIANFPIIFVTDSLQPLSFNINVCYFEAI